MVLFILFQVVSDLETHIADVKVKHVEVENSLKDKIAELEPQHKKLQVGFLQDSVLGMFVKIMCGDSVQRF